MNFTPPDLTFDAARHRYAFAGREQLSVTTALKDAGLIDTFWYTAGDAGRGTRLAIAVERLHRPGAQTIDDVAHDVEVAPYFAAYRAFLQYGNFCVHANEERLCDPALNVAGTLDLRGVFSDSDGGTLDVIDIKSGAVPTWVGYQTAGYVRLLPPIVARRCRRWCLQLRVDATYRLIPLTKRSDEQVFLAAVTVAQAKRGWL